MTFRRHLVPDGSRWHAYVTPSGRNGGRIPYFRCNNGIRFKPKRNLREGDIVILKDELSPPRRWPFDNTTRQAVCSNIAAQLFSGHVTCCSTADRLTITSLAYVRSVYKVVRSERHTCDLDYSDGEGVDLVTCSRLFRCVAL
ncbi:uncharacterized protein LOC124170539 [Ischnura elegans]|uniref:uncharacterized protein LOC124170539 n=1 Tax=Ischnura elegans TaxID=197161 RepID=UPI001ED8A24A|nr:uncharacterized protein LOC124170539 [Ischnura elegans]